LRLELEISQKSIHQKKIYRLSSIKSFKETLQLASEDPTNLAIKDEKNFDIVQEISARFNLQES
jgi:hypothetical protein